MRHPRPPQSPDTRPAQAVIPMLLDVDTGIDDTLALLYAVAEPSIDLLGVTTCAGNTDVDAVVSNSRAILELAGASHVPVAQGAAGPIARPLQTTPDTHGPTGIGYAKAADRGPTMSVSAAELIVQTARERPGEVTLVTLGPLTNLAAAILIEPDLPLLFRDVLVMGGTFAQAGNVTPRVEWNIHVDPEAARVVFQQWSNAMPRNGREITIMGLDVTETSTIDANQLVEMAIAAGFKQTGPTSNAQQIMLTPFGNPILDHVRDALRYYFEFHEVADGFYGAHIHDPFVVGAACDRSLIECSSTVIDVELAGRYTTGELIADWRGHLSQPVNAHVAVTGDGSRFGEHMRSTIARWIAQLDAS